MFKCELSDGSTIPAHAVVAATGVDWRRLDAPGVDQRGALVQG
jgi:alkyl hydroperoxide reductase subunit AhpF